MGSTQTARVISFILNPLFVAAPTFLALLVSAKASDLPVLLLISLSSGTLVPIAILCGLVQRGTIPDLYVSSRENRPMAFASVISSYVLGVALLLVAGAPPIVTAVMLCYLGNILVMMLISAKWKISVHASGIAGPATALAYSLGLVALCLFGLIIPVGWARIRLGAHTLSQVAAGTLLTVATTLLQLRIYLTFL